MARKYDLDLFVIGAGSGGVRASRIAGQYGAKVAVAEERYLGGTCVNVGCIPKKLLVYAAEFGDAFEEAVNRSEDDAAILKWVQDNCAKRTADEVERWNQAMISRHPDTAAKKARFTHFLKEAGGAGRKDIRTYFDLIEFDEGRLK